MRRIVKGEKSKVRPKIGRLFRVVQKNLKTGEAIDLGIESLRDKQKALNFARGHARNQARRYNKGNMIIVGEGTVTLKGYYQYQIIEA